MTDNRVFKIHGSDEKTFFSSEPAKAVFTSGSGDCQTSKRNNSDRRERLCRIAA